MAQPKAPPKASTVCSTLAPGDGGLAALADPLAGPTAFKAVVAHEAAPQLGDVRLTGAGLAESGLLHVRSEEHTSELQSLMRNSYAVVFLKKKRHSNTVIFLHKKNTNPNHISAYQ